MLLLHVARSDGTVGAEEKLLFARISEVVERPFGKDNVGASDLGACDVRSDSRVDVMLPPCAGPPGAMARTQLIGEIAQAICQPNTPDSARHAGLTLIGWLAERCPEEPAHAVGIDEARASEIRLQAGRAKLR
jgi:hypothetical protein